MSKWKIILEHVNNDAETTSITTSGSFDIASVTFKSSPELACMAQTMAMMLSAFENLGKTLPCSGEKVMDHFDYMIKESWCLWDSKAVNL